MIPFLSRLGFFCQVGHKVSQAPPSQERYEQYRNNIGKERFSSETHDPSTCCNGVAYNQPVVNKQENAQHDW